MTMPSRSRTRRVARKLIDESSPLKTSSPVKRNLSETEANEKVRVAKKAKLYDSDDEASSMTTKSFYGKKVSRYVTPLERKAKRESQETDSENTSQSSADENALSDVVKGNSQNKSAKNRVENSKRNGNSQKGSGKPVQQPLREINAQNGLSSESPGSTASSSGSGTKKFFKSRTPQASKRSITDQKGLMASASKMTQKGLQMVYKPASLKTRVVPSSPDIKWKKRSNALVRRSPRKYLSAQVSESGISSVLFHSFDSDSDDSTAQVLRRSPRKQPKKTDNPTSSIESSDLFSEEEESQTSARRNGTHRNVLDVLRGSPKSQSSCADSVSLLSEFESESAACKSPDSKKNRIHPFFNQGTPQQQKLSMSEPSSKSSTPTTKKSLVSSPTNSPTIKLKDDEDQYIIDAGQKMTPVIQCKSCGLTYNPNDGTDKATHQKFHTRVMSILRFQGWKKENVAQDFLDGSRIIVVMATEKQNMKKVNLVKQIVDEDLGFVVDGAIGRYAQIYMFISEDKRIVGFCIAEEIKSAYRMIARDSQTASPLSLSDSSQPWCCSTNPEPAKCGINRIWVLGSERRKGIAKKLLDAVRCTFMMGLVLRCKDLAFTDPTPDGRNFAAAYSGTPSFLVYKHSSKMQSSQ